MTTRQIEFRIALLRHCRGMYDAAREPGIGYQHTILVLTGKRKSSAELESRIRQVMQ